MSVPITVQPDLSEKLSYNYNGLPFVLHINTINRDSGYDALCHWHPELEFLCLLSGERDFFVNGHTFHLTAGQGVFINSKRLHNGFSQTGQDCRFIVMSLHPRLFTGTSEQLTHEAECRFGPDNCDYLLLSGEVGWQQEILQRMRRAFELHSANSGNPLLPLSESLSICGILWDHIPPVDATAADLKNMEAVLRMTDYIQRNYADKISIEEIAKSGTVCRSKACRLFQHYLKQTPNEYLNRYRLAKSLELLRDTELSITEIALICGFQSPSYFISFFHRRYEQTPGEYRSGLQNHSGSVPQS